MYLHFLIGSLLIVLCLGDSSKPAVSSTSVHRYDIPLSYKYSAIHIYSTEKPRRDNNLNQHQQQYTNPEVYRSIQYAPLIFNAKQKNNLYTQAILPNQNEVSLTTYKENVTREHLEPRQQNTNETSSNARPTTLQVIGGYNIEPPTFDKVKYDRKFVIRRPVNNDQFTQQKEITEPWKSTTLYNIHKSNGFREENPLKNLRVLWAMENAQIQPAFNPYVRVPHLHLNVARSYNFARALHKAPVNEYKSNEQSKPKNDLHQTSLYFPLPNYKYLA